MARKPRLFSTAPLSAMRDRELTGLEWRLLLWVSLHDGMSLLKGSGAGCYASNLTLFGEVGCDYSSGCRALSKLVKHGHLLREQLGRSTRYRVVFGAPDNLQAGNISPPGKVAASQAETPEYVAEPHEQPSEISDEHALDYSSLSEELDLEESKELDSIEMAETSFSASLLGINLSAKRAEKKRSGEAELGKGWALRGHLPHNLTQLPVGAQVSRIERAFIEIGSDPDALAHEERKLLSDFLWHVTEEQAGINDDVANQAQRLFEQMAFY